MARHPGSLAAITPLDTPRRRAADLAVPRGKAGGGLPGAAITSTAPAAAGRTRGRPASAIADLRRHLVTGAAWKDLVYFPGYWVRGAAIE